jgi:hypothetical protein
VENNERNWSMTLIDGVVEEAEEKDQKFERTLHEVQDNISLVTKTPWLRRTKWEEIFHGKDMKELVKLTKSPNYQDYQERKLWDSISRVLHDCFKGFLDCIQRGWSLIPFWLASVDRNKENTKPFRTYITTHTLGRYIGYWQQYLIFCVRARMMEECVEFTSRQDNYLLEVIALMNEDVRDECLDAKVLETCVALIQHSDYARQKSSLIYFSGVMGYNPEWKQWRQPQHYTMILAGLQFCIRLIMLEFALPKCSRMEFTEESEVNPIQAFRRVRDIWLIDGEGYCIYIFTNY